MYTTLSLPLSLSLSLSRTHLGDALDELGAGVVAHVARRVACALTDIRQHTSAEYSPYVSIRQHTSVYVTCALEHRLDIVDLPEEGSFENQFNVVRRAAVELKRHEHGAQVKLAEGAI